MDFQKEFDRLIDSALAEDLGGSGDITTMALLQPSTFTSGKFVLKEKAVLAGLPFLEKIFQKVDPKIKVELFVEEGSYHNAGTVFAKVSGPVRGILAGERTALNFLQHATAVATSVAEFVHKVRGLNCAILDTRKTVPGMRAIQQYAFRVGGGVNHRLGLNHHFVIKAVHLAFFAFESSNPIIDAYKQVRSFLPGVPVEIECMTINDVIDSLKTDCESIMLNSMSPDEVKQSLKLARKSNKKVYLESKGNITLETIRRFAETGVDGIATSAAYVEEKPTDIRLRLMI